MLTSATFDLPKLGAKPDKASDRPLLPPPVSAPDSDALAEVRRFHLSGTSSKLAEVQDGLRPALLGRFRDTQTLPTDYPLVLVRTDPDRPLATGFPEAVSKALESLGDARILRDNLRRLHKRLLEQLSEGAPVLAGPAIEQAARAMAESLRLSEAHEQTLLADVQRMCEALGADVELLPFGPHTALYLLAHAAHRARAKRRGAFEGRLDEVIRKLGERLEIERRKDDGRPERIGLGGKDKGLFDPMALSKVIGAHRGPVRMSQARRERLEHVIDRLRAWRASDEPRLIMLHDGALDGVDRSCAEGCRVERVDDPALAVVDRFDEESRRWVERFRALRIAELEVAGKWDEAHHAPWIDHFEWRAFSDEELLAMPPVVAVLGADEVANAGMLPASRALASGRPVKLLSFVRPGHDPRAELGGGYRVELSFFGMAHREAFVHQGTVARPEPLVAAYRAGLDAPRAGLFVIAADEDADGAGYSVGRWLAASAAVEARAHPLFSYAPDAGGSWAERMSVAGNPEPEQAWPRHGLECQARTGAPETLELAFTFADYALLDPALWAWFRMIPEDCPQDVLTSVDHWLELSERDAVDKVPFVWGVDRDNHLHRLVLTRQLAWICRDRQQSWRMLRELGGVRNAHVEAALVKAREEAEADKAAALAERDAEHARALEAAQANAAREVMTRLTAVLLDTEAGPLSAGFSAPVVAAAAPAPAPAAPSEAPAPAAEAAPEPAPAAEVEEDEDEEPWVDSALCTSCNDCVNMNPQLFVYDANKQVVIGDPRAGTYRELVTAAEGCPSKCIHPGTPLNPDEPGLDELRARAKRFQ